MTNRAAQARQRSGVEADSSQPRAPLRLAATRGALGLELYEPVELGPLVVRSLSLSLPGLDFPVDLSGGVPVFRHRRGELECADLELSMPALERWSRDSLRRAIGGEYPGLARYWLVPGGIGIGVSAGDRALAFDLLWAPVEADARVVVSDERGIGLGGPALGPALRVLDSLFGRLGQRQGRVYQVSDLATLLSRSVLPPLGARAASTTGVRLGELEEAPDGLRVRFDRRFPPLASSPRVVRALELAQLAADADDCLAKGDIDAARQHYMAALERAPRHPLLAKLIAEIDLWVEGRQEAALGLVVECGPVAEAGAVGVELLALGGDLAGAVAAAEALATAEIYAPLAALCWQRLAELSPSPSDRFRALDQAVARAPSLARVRWARLDARLAIGDIRAALADVEQLEASAVGASARHAACLRAGWLLLEAGFVRESGGVFERGMRYCPSDPHATWGLAKALGEAGRGARAVALLERAVELGEAQDAVPAGALVDLARVLAELGDLPAAIARLRQVPARTSHELEARGLEATYCARVGDLAGASLAFARVRELLELDPAQDAQRGASWLLAAARFERERLGDLHAAERHLAVALRYAPRDPEVAHAYREAAAQVAGAERQRREAMLELSRGAVATAMGPVSQVAESVEVDAPPAAEDPAQLHATAERLRARLEADPDDDEVALELAIALERLGRDLDLYALISARMEDMGPSGAQRLRPLLVGVLVRLRDAALSEARPREADLYAMQLRRWR